MRSERHAEKTGEWKSCGRSSSAPLVGPRCCGSGRCRFRYQGVVRCWCRCGRRLSTPDLFVRSGALRVLTGRRFPMGTGIDFAGVVAGRGDGVRIDVGAAVWELLRAMTRHVTGTMAEYVVVGADRVAPMPSRVSPAEAASLVVPGPTAVRALVSGS